MGIKMTDQEKTRWLNLKKYVGMKNDIAAEMNQPISGFHLSSVDEASVIAAVEQIERDEAVRHEMANAGYRLNVIPNGYEWQGFNVPIPPDAMEQHCPPVCRACEGAKFHNGQLCCIGSKHKEYMEPVKPDDTCPAFDPEFAYWVKAGRKFGAVPSNYIKLETR